MQVVLGVIAISSSVVLVLGALTGRVRVTNCCSIADPRHDLRMRSAFEDERTTAVENQTSASGRHP